MGRLSPRRPRCSADPGLSGLPSRIHPRSARAPVGYSRIAAMATHTVAPGTACWPCRQRKVKCDNKSPCENCIKREHAQLCSYKPNRSATGKSISISSDNATPGKKRPRSPDEREPRRSLSNEAREAISAYGEPSVRHPARAATC